MCSLCCSRIFPYCGYCTYWNILKDAVAVWTRAFRLVVVSGVSLPLSVSMLVVGGAGLGSCPAHLTNTTAGSGSGLPEEFTVTGDIGTQDPVTELHHIPVWLVVAGILVLLAPVFYFIYDKFCKPENVSLRLS